MREHQKIIHHDRLADFLWDISCGKDWKHSEVFIPQSQWRVWRGVYGTLAGAPQLKTNPPVQRGLWALALLSTTTRLLPFPPCILG